MASANGWREMQATRRDRNMRLARTAALAGNGGDALKRWRSKGRSLTGRPHFAKLMLEKGYVSSIQEAFDEYLDESAKGYVDRQEPDLTAGDTAHRGRGGNFFDRAPDPPGLPRSGAR